MPGAFDVQLRLDPVKMAEIMRGQSGPFVRKLIEDGELVKIEAQRLVGVSQPDPVPRRQPRRPGTLRDSIVKRFAMDGNTPTVIVGSSDPIALWHHEGTQPHSIDAKSAAKPLVFYWPRTGRVMVVRHVNHPGTRPNRFLVNALRVLAGR